VDDTGTVIGFIASPPRRVRIDDRPANAVCSSHLVVAPESRAGALAPCWCADCWRGRRL
jgi:hypothetical protein